MFGLPRSLLLAMAMLVAAPLVALCELAPEERAANLRKVEKWRTDPALFNQLRAAAVTFLEMPAARQEQILRLDRELHALPAPVQARLLDAGRRYTQWLERLPEADRQKVKEAPDLETRLRTIRELRVQEWIRRLPSKQREKIEKAAEDERKELIPQFRREQRQRRRMWQLAFQNWEKLVKKQPLPAALEDFPAEVQTYVNEYLYHWISPEEKTRLERLQGNWPLYPYTLVTMADLHPMALAGPIGPTQFKDLPVEVQNRLSNRLKKGGNTPFLKKVEGKWPDYAIVVTTFARKQGLRLPYELWPSRREDLSALMATFLDKKLLPALSDHEKARLKDAEWKWPLYPRTIQDLARQHRLQIPWQTLPGPRDNWDNYRLLPSGPPSPPANPALLKVEPSAR